MSENIKAHLALLTVALIYGGNYLIAKEVMDVELIHPSAFVLIRVAFGILIFWCISLFIREKVNRSDFGRLLLCGVFGVAVNQLLFFNGLKLTQPIHASLIMTVVPIIVLSLSVLFFSKKLTSRNTSGLAIGAFGAIWLIGGGAMVSVSSDYVLGDLFIFINATSYSIYLLLVKKLLSKYNPVTVITWVFTFGFIIVLPVGFPHMQETNWSELPSYAWASIAYVLIATTVLAYLLNIWALRTVSPTVVAIYIYIQPIFATFLSLLFDKDDLSTDKMLAALLIFTGVFLVSFQGKKR